MNNGFWKMVLVAAILLLGGCAVAEILNVPSQEEMKQVETTRSFAKSYDAVWTATVKKLVTSGYSIQNQDKGSGSISTDYILASEAIDVFTTGSRYKLNIMVEKKTSSKTLVTVVPAFEIRVAASAPWQPTDRKKTQLGVEKELFDGIQASL